VRIKKLYLSDLDNLFSKEGSIDEILHFEGQGHGRSQGQDSMGRLESTACHISRKFQAFNSIILFKN